MTLPAGASRHVQVLRLQPGAPLVLFDGTGAEWAATVTRMGRSEVDVDVGERRLVDRECPFAVTLALGMPANERMDSVVEKATELGAHGIVPLMAERSVLRLSADRATRKVDHWLGVARAAAEQSGRTRVPTIAPVQSLSSWLRSLPPVDDTELRWLLGFKDASAVSGLLARRQHRQGSLLVLSGPEGGFSDTEEASALACGFQPASLGPRVLRADTAPLAVLAYVTLADG